MKKIIFLSIVTMLITQLTLTAQKSGVITYEMTIDVHAALTPAQKTLKAMIPKEKKSKVKITFNENYAKIETMKEESEEKIMISMGGDDMPIYLDLKNKTQISILELEGEHYGTIIPMDEFLEKPIESKTLQILDYACIAYKQEDEVKVMTKTKSTTLNESSNNKEDKGNKATVWVAPNLPKGLSPLGKTFWNGTLLSFKSDLFKYEAIDISFEEIKDNAVLPEVEFKEITEEQMNDLQEEKTEELINSIKQ